MARTSRMPWQRSARYGVIDIGTNSCLLLIGEVHFSSGEYRVLHEDVVITQLGQGFYAVNRLQEDAIARTIATVAQFWSRCQDEDVDEVVVTGTSVLRDADNSDTFRQSLESRIDSALEIISGEEEARLSYLAVRRDPTLPVRDDGLCIVTDVGGGSTELILGTDRIRRMASLDVGSVRVTEAFLGVDLPTAAQIDALRGHLRQVFEEAPASDASGFLVGVGGTITTLANIEAHRRDPVPPVHGFGLTLHSLRDEIELLSGLTLDERRDLPGLEPKRAGVILGGAVITEHVMTHYGKAEIWTSVRGLRHGVFADRFLDAETE